MLIFRMFTDSPEAKDAFGNFSEIDVNDKQYNEALRRHGGRVKGAVGRVIQSLKKPNEYKKYLSKMGCRHYKEYNFEPTYTEVIALHLKLIYMNNVRNVCVHVYRLTYLFLFFSLVAYYECLRSIFSGYRCSKVKSSIICFSMEHSPQYAMLYSC